MAAVEYLDPSIANEGISANDWKPGAWADAVSLSDDEWQPDLEPPRVNDYAAFKKHKHYGRYFRPWKYQPFPAWLYHPTLEPKLIDARFRDGAVDNEACKATAMKLGPEWRREPYPKDTAKVMVGKMLPVKNDTQRLTEAIAAGLADNKATGSGPVDAASIAAIVAAVMAAMPQPLGAPVAVPAAEVAPTRTRRTKAEMVAAEEAAKVSEAATERTALVELAEKEGIVIDDAMTNEEIKKALGL